MARLPSSRYIDGLASSGGGSVRTIVEKASSTDTDDGFVKDEGQRYRAYVGLMLVIIWLRRLTFDRQTPHLHVPIHPIALRPLSSPVSTDGVVPDKKVDWHETTYFILTPALPKVATGVSTLHVASVLSLSMIMLVLTQSLTLEQKVIGVICMPCSSNPLQKDDSTDDLIIATG